MANNKNQNPPVNPNSEWKNSWKNGWKDTAFQNVSDDTYTYQRPDERSAYQQWKDYKKDMKSDYKGVRQQARENASKIILPALGSFIVVAIVVVYFLFFK